MGIVRVWDHVALPRPIVLTPGQCVGQPVAEAVGEAATDFQLQPVVGRVGIIEGLTNRTEALERPKGVHVDSAGTAAGRRARPHNELIDVLLPLAIETTAPNVAYADHRAV